MVTISSKLSVEDALHRFDRLLESASQSCTLAGKRDGRSFSVMRAQRFGNSVMRPQLAGSIEQTEAGCVIKSEFGFRQSVKISLRLWFVFIGLWTIASGLIAFHTGPASLWLLPAAGVTMALMGVLFVQFSKSYYRSDREWLAKLLSEELGG